MIGNMIETYYNREAYTTNLHQKLPKGIKQKEKERYHATFLDLIVVMP